MLVLFVESCWQGSMKWVKGLIHSRTAREIWIEVRHGVDLRPLKSNTVMLTMLLLDIRQFHVISVLPRSAYELTYAWQSAWNHCSQLSKTTPLSLYDTGRSHANIPQLHGKEGDEGVWWSPPLDVHWPVVSEQLDCWVVVLPSLTGLGFGSGAKDIDRRRLARERRTSFWWESVFLWHLERVWTKTEQHVPTSLNTVLCWKLIHEISRWLSGSEVWSAIF